MADDTHTRGRTKRPARVTRRGFLRAGAAAGAGVALSKLAFVRDVHAADDVNVALIGAGRQGRVLIMSMLKRSPNIRFKAVCDIWKYSSRYSSKILEKFKQPVNVYEDYREMLAAEPDLDAVVIATPDWMHAPQTVACLEAGLHVYCETGMSNTLEGCRAMVRAARKTGKLLQIGRQRRSNPRYLRAYDVIAEKKWLGRVTHCNGQWNRAKRAERNIPKRWAIDEVTLKEYGYDTIERFGNWRRYRKFSGGAMADLGSHQLDVFSWFLGCAPKSVVASGGRDYYERQEWYDNVMALYEYATPAGTARVLYQILKTTSYGGFHEVFMGDKGTIQISEDPRIGFFFPEPTKQQPQWVPAQGGNVKIALGPTPIAPQRKLDLPADAKKPVHQYHLENFFSAILGEGKLTCSAGTAFATAVAMLRTNDAIASGERIALTEKDYDV
jgi:predicted dehydrogenase